MKRRHETGKIIIRGSFTSRWGIVMIGMGGTLTCTLLKAKYNDIFYKLKRLCLLPRSFQQYRRNSWAVSEYLFIQVCRLKHNWSLIGFRSWGRMPLWTQNLLKHATTAILLPEWPLQALDLTSFPTETLDTLAKAQCSPRLWWQSPHNLFDRGWMNFGLEVRCLIVKFCFGSWMSVSPMPITQQESCHNKSPLVHNPYKHITIIQISECFSSATRLSRASQISLVSPNIFFINLEHQSLQR